jgi:hypothetical protein
LEVTEDLVTEAATALGVTPSFWGRYFTSITAGDGEYRHRVEDPILAALGIRVLPIARQTPRVGGSLDRGLTDGLANGADLLATFGASLLGAMPGVRIFLDVEGDETSRLSRDYYTGWTSGLSQAMGDVRVMPCVYGIPADETTWRALSGAVSAGVACYGVWLSHPNAAAEPVPWTPGMLAPFQEIPGVPILFWQYHFGPSFDRNLLNPDVDDSVLDTLVSPPRTLPAVVA